MLTIYRSVGCNNYVVASFLCNHHEGGSLIHEAEEGYDSILIISQEKNSKLLAGQTKIYQINDVSKKKHEK